MPTTPQDDRKADFTARVEANMDALYSVALRLTRNSADAQDLVAETVSRAWVARDQLENRALFRPWVFRILRNAFVSDCRRKAVRPVESRYQDLLADDDGDVASLLVEESDEFLDWWSNPEQRVSNDHLGAQIMAAIDNLPAVFRTTVLLVNVDGLTYDEAADVLGVPPGTVRSRMKRGRTQLQKALWQQAQDEGLAVAARGRGDAP